MTPEARRVLVEAKGLVSRGWFQDRGDGSTYCVATAIVTAAGGDQALICEAQDIVESLVSGCVVDWNDDPARTHAEVVALFDKALMAPLSEWDREAVSRTPLGRAHGGMSPRVASHSLSGGAVSA